MIDLEEYKKLLNLSGDGPFYTEFEHKHPGDTIWWTEEVGRIGQFLFSFDKKKIYNFFRDYPEELTPEEKELFDKENAEFVSYFHRG